MKNIYCISGIGADHRLFKKLSVPGYTLVALPWVPFESNDNMASYAMKMFACIPEKSPVIIGLSFGGMLAIEIAKAHPECTVFIVSSAKKSSEVKIHGGALSRWLIRSMVLPARFFIIPSATAIYYLGAQDEGEKQLLRQIMRDSNGRFMKWALKAIATWHNDVLPAGGVHIHGTNDKTIPSSGVHPDYWIEGGGHTMIYNRADEVARIISECLSK